MTHIDHSTKELTRYYANVCSDIRCEIIDLIYGKQIGHEGGSLSCVEILVALYYEILRGLETGPQRNGRDLCILSKGHASAALYTVLVQRGLISREMLQTYGDISSALQCHPDMTKCSWVDFSTGALGQGLSVGAGFGWVARHSQRDQRVFVIMGDGETQEGQVWEAAQHIARESLCNVIAIVDCNGLQQTTQILNGSRIEDLFGKFSAFGWRVIITDGDQVLSVSSAIETALSEKQPVSILVRTRKGQGVSFMEDAVEWHSRVMTEGEYAAARLELKSRKGAS